MRLFHFLNAEYVLDDLRRRNATKPARPRLRSIIVDGSGIVELVNTHLPVAPLQAE
jgi:hypothetical protein